MHTKEPWGIEASDTDYMLVAENPKGHWSLIGATTANIEGSMEVTDEEAKQNAKRIVACVNACVGIPTELLQQLKPGTLGALVTYNATTLILSVHHKDNT